MMRERDWVSRTVSVLALGLSMFTLWYSSFRVENDLDARIVHAGIKRSDSVGSDTMVVDVAYMNTGNRPATVLAPQFMFKPNVLVLEPAHTDVLCDRRFPMTVEPQTMELVVMKLPVAQVPVEYATYSGWHEEAPYVGNEDGELIKAGSDVPLRMIECAIHHGALDSKGELHSMSGPYTLRVHLPGPFLGMVSNDRTDDLWFSSAERIGLQVIDKESVSVF